LPFYRRKSFIFIHFRTTSMEQQPPVVARCIVDILGAPKEFIAKTLREHIDKLKQDGLDIQFEKYAEPKPSDKLFTQFVELQISFKDVQELLDFCFDSMPSSVEIISPAKLQIDMTRFETLINDLQAKLHQTDLMLKGLQAQKQVLDKNAINIFHNFIKFACRTKPHTLDELSKLLGIGIKELSPFVDGLVSEGALKKEGQVFSTNG